MKAAVWFGAALAIAAVTASPARAQSDDSRAYVDLNVGVQAQSHNAANVAGFALYGETGTVSALQTIGVGLNGDIGGGRRISERLGIGAAFSIFSRSSDVAFTASVPSPVAFNSFSSSTGSASGLRHTEAGIHVKLQYFKPLSEKVELAISGGPSFIRVYHAVATGSVGAGSSTVTVASGEQKGTAIGGNGGLDLVYRLPSRRYGIGAFVRYAGGSVDLPAISGLKVGGIQAGGGLRFRF